MIIFLSFLVLQVVASDYECHTSYIYQKVCHLYEFEGHCQPYAIENCTPIKTSYAIDKCPTYDCV